VQGEHGRPVEDVLREHAQESNGSLMVSYTIGESTPHVVEHIDSLITVSGVNAH